MPLNSHQNLDILYLLGQPSFFDLPLAVVVCSATILAMLFWNVMALIADTVPIHSALTKALTYIKQINPPLTARALQDVHRTFSADPVIGEAWTEFHETLIVGDPAVDPDAPVFNTRQANDLINESTIVSRRMNVNWYLAVPGMLTAIGLIGSFLSIFLALSTLQVENPSQSASLNSPASVMAGQTILDNLPPFINRLSGKFVSSILGLGCAFLFILLEKSSCGLGGIERSCASFQAELNKLCTFAPQEVLLQAISQKAEKTFQTLADLKRDLPACINDGLFAAVTGPVAGIRLQVEELARIADEQARKREESITKLVSTVVQSFKQALFDATNKEFDLLAAALAKTSGVVDALNEKLAQSMDQQDALIQSSKNQIESLIKYQKDQTDAFMNGSRDMQLQLIDGLRQHCEQLVKDQSTEMDSLLQSIQTASGQMVKTNERISDALLSKLGSQFDKFLSQIESNSGKQLQLMQNSHEYMVNNLDTWITSATEDLEKLVRLIGEESQRANGNVTLVTENMSILASMAKSNARLESQASTAISGFHDILKSIAAVGESTREKSDQIESLVLELAERHKDHQSILQAQEQFLAKCLRSYQKLGAATDAGVISDGKGDVAGALALTSTGNSQNGGSGGSNRNNNSGGGGSGNNSSGSGGGSSGSSNQHD